jgi:hypothetical protein
VTAELWPTVESLIEANLDAARRARADGDVRRAHTHEAAARLLETGPR